MPDQPIANTSFTDERDLTQWLAQFYNDTMEITFRGKIFVFKKEIPIGKILHTLKFDANGNPILNADSVLALICAYSHDPKISLSNAKLLPVEFIDQVRPLFDDLEFSHAEKKKRVI